MTYLMLAYEFFKAGLFAIGGGLATLPYLMEIAHTHPEWYSISDLMNMIAISESTPGPLGVNMSSYVGYHVGGFFGAVVSTFSLVLPSYIIILIVIRILDKFRTNRYISGGLEGLHPAVTGLIAAAAYSVLWASVVHQVGAQYTFDWLAFILFLCFLTVIRLKPLKKIHPLLFIATGAVLGIVLGL